MPWNTCAVYMVTVLGVPCLAYAPYAFFCYLYPLVIIVAGMFFSRKLGWISRPEPVEPEAVAVREGCPDGVTAAQNA